MQTVYIFTRLKAELIGVQVGMTKQEISLTNMPDSLEKSGMVIQSASQVKPLSLFTNAHNEGDIVNSLSQAFSLYDLWSRFVRGRNLKLPANQAPARVIKKRQFSERVDGIHYEGEFGISPAFMECKDQDYIMWPSDREEKVEAALISLATKDKIVKVLSASSERYAICFTIKELIDVLKSVNQSLSNPEVKESLTILSKSHLSFMFKVTDDKGSIESREATVPFIGAIHYSNKRGRSAQKCIVFLNDYMTQQIESMSYTGFYFNRTQQFSGALPRWLAKRLYQMFRYARTDTTYHFTLISMMVKFGAITSDEQVATKLVALRRNMTSAVKDLINEGILKKYSVSTIKNDEGQVIDNKYVLMPSERFCEEVLALNKHQRKLKEKLKKDSVDIFALEDA